MTSYAEWYGLDCQDDFDYAEFDPREPEDDPEWIAGVDWSEDVVLDDGTIAGQQSRIVPDDELVPF